MGRTLCASPWTRRRKGRCLQHRHCFALLCLGRLRVCPTPGMVPELLQAAWGWLQAPVRAAKRDEKMGHGARPGKDTLRLTQGPQHCLGPGARPRLGCAGCRRESRASTLSTPKAKPSTASEGHRDGKISAEHQPRQNNQSHSPTLRLYPGGETSDKFTCHWSRSREMLPPSEPCY